MSPSSLPKTAVKDSAERQRLSGSFDVVIIGSGAGCSKGCDDDRGRGFHLQ